MNELNEKTVTVKIKDEKDNVTYKDKVVLAYDLDYGYERRERQKRERNVRLKEWQKLSPYEQLKSLDERLGKNQGATKQRAKIQAKIQSLQNKANYKRKSK